MESSVKAEEVLLLEEEVTDSRVLSPARLTVVKAKVPFVSAAVLDTGDEASPCLGVVSELSWGGVAFSVDIQELASQDTAGEESDVCSVLK